MIAVLNGLQRRAICCSRPSTFISAGAGLAEALGLGSIGLDLGFFNVSFNNSGGHKVLNVGLLGAEEKFDLFHGHIDTDFGFHLGLGIPGVIGGSVDYGRKIDDAVLQVHSGKPDGG